VKEMPTSNKTPKHNSHKKTKSAPTASPNGDVLNLTETAHYLRVTEDEVARLIREQGLPARKLGNEWRFLKAAIQDWLRAPSSKKEGLLMQLGAFKDDPSLAEMLQNIHEQRGRRVIEGD
jgi:excisionase family DNA binding protein